MIRKRKRHSIQKQKNDVALPQYNSGEIILCYIGHPNKNARPEKIPSAFVQLTDFHLPKVVRSRQDSCQHWLSQRHVIRARRLGKTRCCHSRQKRYVCSVWATTREARTPLYHSKALMRAVQIDLQKDIRIIPHR